MFIFCKGLVSHDGLGIFRGAYIISFYYRMEITWAYLEGNLCQQFSIHASDNIGGSIIDDNIIPLSELHKRE